MMNNQESIYLNLTPDTKVLIALTHTHIQPLDALCELIDNAIDSFSSAKLQGNPVKNPVVRIDLPQKSDIDNAQGLVRVSDNGPGLSVENAEKALRAGFSGNNPYDTLGLFGMGFNISTGKMGSVTRFFSARADEETAVEVTIDLNKINQSKNYTVEAYRVSKGSMEHGTVIEISDWWPNGNANRGFIKTLVSYGGKKIREEIGRRYATLLKKKEVKIIINEVECVGFEHCIWDDSRYVERKKHGRIPAVYRFDTVVHTQKKCTKCTATLESYQTSCPSCGSFEIRTIEERIRGWVGIQRFDDLSEFGVDLIRNGRAIRISEKSAFFEYIDEFQKSHKDYPIDSNFGRIVGEVHLNHVPVDFMKQDFQRSSPEWHRAITFLRGNSSLQPLQPGADLNESPIFKLFQGYRKVKTAGKTDMYMGKWDPVKEEPVRISRDVEKEFYERFLKHEPGYYDDAEWWKKVEEADMKPVKKLPLCPECGCQNIEEAEVCLGCQAVLKGQNCPDCGEYIPLSAKNCPKCGKNLGPEILKNWTCQICNTKNNPIFSECINCGSPRNTENYLTSEYLMKHSEKDDTLSIDGCSVMLSNGQMSTPLNITVFVTNMPIKSNLDDRAIPLFTEKKSLDEVYIFIDKSHRMFKSCRIKVEQLIAGSIAEHIFILNKAINNSAGKHTVPYLSWQIIEKYWADKLEDNGEDILSAIKNLEYVIKERLVLSHGGSLEQYYDLLSNEQTKEMVNEMINAGIDISTGMAEHKKSGLFVKYAPLSFIISLFDLKPELFFDGCVWSEAYLKIDVPTDIIGFMQNRTKSLYKSCFDDLLYYVNYKNQTDFVIQKTKLAIQLLKQKVAE